MVEQPTQEQCAHLRREQERQDASVPTDEKGAAIGYRCHYNHGGSGRVYLACTGHWQCAGCGTFVSTETVRGVR